MNDKELLEAAAKAAGETVVVRTDTGVLVRAKHRNQPWVPIDDNNDALVLQSRLLMSVSNHIVYVCASTVQTTLAGIFSKEECIKQSVEQATRRAIVRAAAAIGEQL